MKNGFPVNVSWLLLCGPLKRNLHLLGVNDAEAFYAVSPDLFAATL